MRGTPLRIATFAAPLSGNKGSASMIFGLIDGCAGEDPPVEISVFSYYPHADAPIAEKLNGVAVHPGHPVDLAFGLLPFLALSRITPRLVPSSWRAGVACIENCHVVAILGGTTFADSMLYKVLWNVLAALPAYLLGKPTFFLSQTIGPMNHPLNRAAARWVFRRARHVSGRGGSSTGWLERIGIAHVANHPDLSFCMKVPPFDRLANEAPSIGALRDWLAALGKEPIGIAPNSIVDAKAAATGRDYPGMVAALIKEIARLGFAPVLIAHSYRPDSASSHNNDRGLCKAILERLEPGTECWFVDVDLSPQDLRSLVGRCHVVVASRFHAMISALATGVVPVTVGWGGHKYEEVLQEFGLQDFYAGYDELTAEALFALLHQALARRSELMERIAEALPHMRQRSQAGIRLLLAGAEDVPGGGASDV